MIHTACVIIYTMLMNMKKFNGNFAQLCSIDLPANFNYN